MLQSESLKELAPALAAAQAEFKAVSKSGENTYDKYSYAKLEDFVVTTHPILSKHGLIVLTSVVDVSSMDTRQTKNGSNEYPVRVKIVQRIMHKSGEWIETESFGDGQDRGDKGIYKAITGARKYGLAAALNLATTDDPEADAGAGDATLREGKRAIGELAGAKKGGGRAKPEPAGDFL